MHWFEYSRLHMLTHMGVSILILATTVAHSDDSVRVPSLLVTDDEDEFTADLRLVNDEALDAISIEVCYDDEVLDATAVECPLSDTEFCLVEFASGSIEIDLIFDDDGLRASSSLGRRVARIDFDVLEPRPESTELELCDAILVDTEATEIVPELTDGVVSFVEYAFRRGDVDGDGIVFVILDAIAVMNWGFKGGDAPPCAAAADVDGNGVVFPLVEAVYLFNYGYGNGPRPPTPGPDECGVGTEDDDELGCQADAC